jgi:hypothetical protein
LEQRLSVPTRTSVNEVVSSTRNQLYPGLSSGKVDMVAANEQVQHRGETNATTNLASRRHRGLRIAESIESASK